MHYITLYINPIWTKLQNLNNVMFDVNPVRTAYASQCDIRLESKEVKSSFLKGSRIAIVYLKSEHFTKYSNLTSKYRLSVSFKSGMAFVVNVPKSLKIYRILIQVRTMKRTTHSSTYVLGSHEQKAYNVNEG